MKKQTLILAGLLTGILLSVGNMTVYAKPSATVNTVVNDAIPYAVNYVWIYKTENGKMYRRLYDSTHQRWAGDWELVP